MANSTGIWAPWLGLQNAPVIETRSGIKPSLFLGSRIDIGDDREILQGDGHANQCVAVTINGDVARRIKHAVNCHDDLLAALKLVQAMNFLKHGEESKVVAATIAKAEGRAPAPTLNAHGTDTSAVEASKPI